MWKLYKIDIELSNFTRFLNIVYKISSPIILQFFNNFLHII